MIPTAVVSSRSSIIADVIESIGALPEGGELVLKVLRWVERVHLLPIPLQLHQQPYDDPENIIVNLSS